MFTLKKTLAAMPPLIVVRESRACWRPKQRESGDGSKEKSPSLSESDTEEKCSASCSCNSQQSKGIQGSNQLRANLSKLKDETIKNNVNTLSLPKYRPTPISELQKRCEENVETIENCFQAFKTSELYLPNGLGISSLVSYSPSDIATLNIKQENVTDSSALYSPIPVTCDVKEEYHPSCNESDIKDYKPSNINLIKVNEPTYTPEDISGNGERFNYKPSNKLSIIKQEPEYSPSGGSNTTKPRLEYTPSSSISSSNKNQEYNPIKAVTSTKNSSKDKKEIGRSKENVETLKYIPTEKSKLPIVKKYDEIDIFSKNNTKSKSSSSKNTSSHSKDAEKSSDRSSRKHKRSHSSSSSRDNKKLKTDSSSSKTENKKEESKKSSSQNVDKSDKEKNNSGRKSHSQASKHSSSSSSRKDHKDHKHSSSSKEKDKNRSRSSSSHHQSDKKSSHRDKFESNRHRSSHSKDSSKEKQDINGSKDPQKCIHIDLTDESSQDLFQELISEESPEVVYKECYRIFEEFEFETTDSKTMQIPEKSENCPVQEKAPVAHITDHNDHITVTAPPTKKRIAHEAASHKAPLAKARRIRPVSATAGQMLADRWRKQQELQKMANAGASSSSSNSGVSALLSELMDESAPKPVMPWLKKGKAAFGLNQISNSEERTVAQSAKGKQRIAHKAKEELLDRPIVRAAPGDKIPCSRRQHALDKLAEHCIRIYPSQKDAFNKAVELELICFGKSQTVAVYNNLFVNQVLRLKHATTPSAVLAMNQQPVSSNSRVIASFNQGIMSTQFVQRDYVFKGPELYKRMERYKIPVDDQQNLGYPYPHPEEYRNGVAKVQKIVYPGQTMPVQRDLPSHKRECFRCHQIYDVDRHGMQEELVDDEKCCYHPKRAYKKKVQGCIELLHECCGRISERYTGCAFHKFHVTETFELEHLPGFVKTFNKEQSKERAGIFAMDCEMCITTKGTEVTRVTVVNENNEQVFDTLIKPENPVLDYCTEYSGVTEEMMLNVTTTLRDVQIKLLDLFSEDTILIGHSLNNDLQVLKIIHETVVDTSIVFPHKEGLPKRRALKNVYRDCLNKSIQDSVDGHDSYEDAKACMELMQYRVREDAKLA